MSLALLLAVLSITHSVPQPPSPSRRETSQPQQTNSNSAKQKTPSIQRGTEDAPVFVKEIPTRKSQEETTEETKEREEKTTNDRKLVDLTGLLVVATALLALVGIFQLFVFGDQAHQLRKTVKAAGEQSEDMKRSIAEANRSATAMEDLAKHVEASSKAAVDSVAVLRQRTAQQMRAYLTVLVGEATYQERSPKPLKFEARPLLLNTGQTPAHRVRYVANAKVMPIPLPDDFSFPLMDDSIGSSVLGPHQHNQLFAVVEDFYDDKEIDDIKAANGKALFVWGIVRYEDIFGDPQTTKFCQMIMWKPDRTIFGIFIPRHNEST